LDSGSAPFGEYTFPLIVVFCAKAVMLNNASVSSRTVRPAREDPEAHLTESEELEIGENIVRREQTNGCIFL
jgi:hypothetical protein